MSLERNIARGVVLTMMSLVFGTLLHYNRVHEFGLQGPLINQNISGEWGGPLSWKFMQQGDVKVPTVKY